ncbi:hypothetical protein AYL99_00136 [Fonsecaea erecta]|uniref:Uncharacterized protein n=1 Tax=Fonsecaea erecta TaxID=1367422 RepID=A0A178ZWK6_9EURO|nr:hypothetical protein AYL99_00136 [Fonsecaea erecta]OAP64164.1 hypothetical protein AYL99_00136 [Fonsecaea erecta]
MSSSQQDRGRGSGSNRPSSNIQAALGVNQETDTIRPRGYGDDRYSDFDKSRERPERPKRQEPNEDRPHERSLRQRIKDKVKKILGLK